MIFAPMTLRWDVVLPPDSPPESTERWAEAIAVSCRRWTPSLVDDGVLDRYELRFTPADAFDQTASDDQPAIVLWVAPTLPPPSFGDGNPAVRLIQTSSPATVDLMRRWGWLPICWSGELSRWEPLMARFCRRMGLGDG